MHMEGPMLGKMAYGARAWRLTCTHRRERRVAPDRTRAASLQKEPTRRAHLYTGAITVTMYYTVAVEL